MEETNYQLIKKLFETFVPKNYGFLLASEVKTISKDLQLNNRDILSLRNLRDSVVMYSCILDDSNTNNKESLKLMDKVSAITSVIDNKIFNLGGEV